MALGIPNGLQTQSFCAPISTLRRGGIDFLAIREVYLTGRLGLAWLQMGNMQCLLTERGRRWLCTVIGPAGEHRDWGQRSSLGRHSFCAAAPGGEPRGLRMDRAGEKSSFK